MSDLRDLIHRFVDAINERDEDAIDDIVDPDYHQHDQTIADGRASLKSYLRSLRGNMSDLRVDVDHLMVDGDRVAGWSTMRGGDGTVTRAANVWRVRDGRLVEHWEITEDSPPAALATVRSQHGGGSAWTDHRRIDPRGVLRLDALDVVNGVTFADPYRWLEQESRETQHWQRGQHEKAGAWLHALPGFEGLRARVDELLGQASVSAPKRRGGRWFTIQRGPSGGPELQVAVVAGGPWRTVLAPGDLEIGDRGAPDWHEPSPDGRMVAIGTSVNGDEQSTMHVVDVATGAVVGTPVPYVSGGAVSWLPDSSGLFAGVGRARDTESSLKDVVVWSVDEGRVTTILDLDSPERMLIPYVSPSGRWLVVHGSAICPRALHVVDLVADARTDVFGADVDLRFSGVVVGDEYIAVTTEGADRGRIVAVPLPRLDDRSRWREIVPESDAVVRSVQASGGELIVHEFVDGASRIRVLSLDGDEQAVVPLPSPGTASLGGLFTFQIGGQPSADLGDGHLSFVASTIESAPSRCVFDVAARELVVIDADRPRLDVVVERHRLALDDFDLAYTVVKRADVGEGPAPTLVSTYGGWNVVFLTEFFLGIHASFVEAGGTLVLAHLRGDGTFGDRQWKSGRRQHKQRGFDDLYAVVDELVEQGVSCPDRIGLFGTSNGGLLGAVAACQRPELFAAIVSAVPLIDMARYPNERFSEMFAEEYGDPLDPAFSALLRSYSPYHNLPDTGALPAMLFVAGASDIRCQPWHARKMAAAAQATQTADRPILLRVHPYEGHATTVAGPSHVIAEWLAFLNHQLGLPLVPSAQQTAHQLDPSKTGAHA